MLFIETTFVLYLSATRHAIVVSAPSIYLNNSKPTHFACSSRVSPVEPVASRPSTISVERESTPLPEDVESSGEVAVDDGNIYVRKNLALLVQDVFRASPVFRQCSCLSGRRAFG